MKNKQVSTHVRFSGLFFRSVPGHIIIAFANNGNAAHFSRIRLSVPVKGKNYRLRERVGRRENEMETAYSEIIRSFVDTYGLSRGQVIAEIEKTFSSMLSRWHEQDVMALFTDDRLMAVGYHHGSDGMAQQVPIRLTTMRGWNSIRRILEQNLEKAACLQEVARYKKKEHQLLWGEIVRKNRDGSLLVEVEIESGAPIIAECPGHHIGIHEREELMMGQRRAKKILLLPGTGE